MERGKPGGISNSPEPQPTFCGANFNKSTGSLKKITGSLKKITGNLKKITGSFNKSTGKCGARREERGKARRDFQLSRAVAHILRSEFQQEYGEFQRDAQPPQKSLRKRQPRWAARFYKVKIRRNFQPAKCRLHSFSFRFSATFRPFHPGFALQGRGSESFGQALRSFVGACGASGSDKNAYLCLTSGRRRAPHRSGLHFF